MNARSHHLENPYEAAPSVAEPIQASDASRVNGSWLSRLLSIFLGWERWRLAYNAVLGGVALALAFPQLPDLSEVAILIRLAIFANVCYFAGPITESMLRLIGIRGRPVRWCLLATGTLCMLFLTWVVLSGSLLPDQQ